MTGASLNWLIKGEGEMLDYELPQNFNELEERIIRRIEKRLDDREKLMEKRDALEQQQKRLKKD